MKNLNPVNTNQQLADHIKKNILKGYTMDSLRYSLVSQGYSRTTIEKAIELAKKQMPASSQKEQIRVEKIAPVMDDKEMAARIAAQDAQNKGFFKRLFSRFFG